MGLINRRNAEYKLYTQGAYENEKFWIKILNLCPEGNITCNKVVYVGVNKSNGDYIILNGNSISDTNMNFKGYS